MLDVNFSIRITDEFVTVFLKCLPMIATLISALVRVNRNNGSKKSRAEKKKKKESRN